MANRNLSWQLFPLARPALSLIGGGAAYLHYYIDPISITSLTLLLIVGLFCTRNFKLLWAVNLYLVFFCIGFTHMAHLDRSFHFDPRVEIHKPLTIALKVDRANWDEDHSRWKLYAKAVTFHYSSPIGVYTWLNDTISIKKGDLLIAKTKFKKVRKSPFPGGFDFSAFLKKKKIKYTLWLKPHQVIEHIPSSREQSSFWYKWKRKRIEHLKNNLSAKSYGIYAAILFGASKELDQDVRKQFSELGIAHILAVSGMHVGILVACVSAALNLFGKFRNKRWIAFIIISLSTYFYIMICDFAPSASRAGLMAIVYYFARALRIQQIGLNSLAFSSILLFLLDPYIIIDLGAQLSFMAMMGIFILYPPIFEWFRLKVPLPKQLSSMLCISLAAQLSLFPLLLYYFGQVPLFFWLFGLPAAYFATFTFCSGWLMVILDCFMNIPVWSTEILSAIVDKFLLFVSHASQSGNLILSQTHFDIVDMSCLLTIVILIGQWLYTKTLHKRLIRIKMISLLICSFLWYGNTKRLNATVHSIESSKNTVVLIKIKNRAWSFSHEPLNEHDRTAIMESYPIDSLIAVVE